MRISAVLLCLTSACATVAPPPPPPPLTAPLAEREAHDARYGVRQAEQRNAFEPLTVQLNDGRTLTDATTLRGQVADDSPTAIALDAEAARLPIVLGLGAAALAAYVAVWVGSAFVGNQMTTPEGEVVFTPVGFLVGHQLFMALAIATLPVALDPPPFLRSHRQAAMVHAKEDMQAHLGLDQREAGAALLIEANTPQCSAAWRARAASLAIGENAPALRIQIDEQPHDSRMQFLVRIADALGPRDQRQFEAASCEEVADATALYLAGVIDAEAARPKAPHHVPLHVRGIVAMGTPLMSCAYLSDGREICTPDDVLALVPAGSEAAKHAEGARFWRHVSLAAIAGMTVGALGQAASFGSLLVAPSTTSDFLFWGGLAAQGVGLLCGGVLLLAQMQPDMHDALKGIQPHLQATTTTTSDGEE